MKLHLAEDAKPVVHEIESLAQVSARWVPPLVLKFCPLVDPVGSMSAAGLEPMFASALKLNPSRS